jgi:hypothetical protein
MAVHTQFSALDGIDTFVLNNLNSGTGIIGGGGTIGGGVVPRSGVAQATALRILPFRPAQVGRITFVDKDKALLSARVPALDLKSASLSDAINRLASTTRQNIVLSLRAFQQAHIDTSSKSNLSLPAGTLKEALQSLLQTAAPNIDLVITAEDKVIQVTTQAQADLMLITKTYYLNDLLANLPRFVPANTDLSAVGAKNQPPAADEDESLADFSHSLDFSKPPQPHPHHSAPAHARASNPSSTNIVDLITDTVRPEIWRNHGGKSEIYSVNDKVTIKAPASVHALLEGPSHHNPDAAPMYIMQGR